jgi:hypothetical protein
VQEVSSSQHWQVYVVISLPALLRAADVYLQAKRRLSKQLELEALQLTPIE